MKTPSNESTRLILARLVLLCGMIATSAIVVGQPMKPGEYKKFKGTLNLDGEIIPMGYVMECLETRVTNPMYPEVKLIEYRTTYFILDTDPGIGLVKIEIEYIDTGRVREYDFTMFNTKMQYREQVLK